jgi:hypothetical protein
VKEVVSISLLERLFSYFYGIRISIEEKFKL